MIRREGREDGGDADRWLDPPADDVEATLRRAIDIAAERDVDQLALRRVWNRVAEPRPSVARAPRLGTWVLLGGVAAACTTALALLVWAPRPEVPVVVETAPAAPETEEGPATPPATRTRVKGPTVLRTGAGETLRAELEGGAEVELAAGAALALDGEHRPEVRTGRVSLHVPKQAAGRHYEVIAGPYRIVVVGTRFEVGVDGRKVEVDVREGVVEVWRGNRAVRVEAGLGWSGDFVPPSRRAPLPAARRDVPRTAVELAPSASARPLVAQAEVPAAPSPSAPAPAPVASAVPTTRPDAVRQARAVLLAGKPAEAVAILEAAMRRDGGPEAQNAAYELGRVLRDHLLKPRDAVAVWRSYQRRHPQGLLRPEVDLSLVETLTRLGDDAAAVAEARAFLRRHPHSERRAELEALVARLSKP